jgi:hypothetical protein
MMVERNNYVLEINTELIVIHAERRELQTKIDALTMEVEGLHDDIH